MERIFDASENDNLDTLLAALKGILPGTTVRFPLPADDVMRAHSAFFFASLSAVGGVPVRQGAPGPQGQADDVEDGHGLAKLTPRPVFPSPRSTFFVVYRLAPLVFAPLF